MSRWTRSLTVLTLLTVPATAPCLGQVLEIDGDLRMSGGGGGAVNLRTGNNSSLQVQTESTAMSFLVDSNQDQANTTTHQFTWWVNNFAQASRGMQFTIQQGSDDGTLRVAGPVISNGFDLAESFWMSEPIEPGQVVAVDPGRRDAVVPSGGAYDRRVLGVASARPALLMGGSVFSLEQLERNWGTSAVRLFESERAELEVEALTRVPDLAEGSSVDLFDHVMARFFERHIVSVAVAGRVPVLADASNGPIAPGDPLTAGPTPGTAMRADRPGPIIGHALETLAEGRGTVLALVQRGWFADDSRRQNLPGSESASSLIDDAIARLHREHRALLAARDLEIAELRQRLDSLAWHLQAKDQGEHCRPEQRLAATTPAIPDALPGRREVEDW